MKKQTVLQYLSTTSDTFLLVAFFSLLALPFAFGLAVQPVRDQAQRNDLANVQAKADQNKSIAANSNANTSPVLGATDTKLEVQNPLQNVDVKVLTSADVKKYLVNEVSMTTGEYIANVTTKASGTYGVMSFKNNNTTPLKLNVNVEFTDTKLASVTFTLNGQPYTISLTDAKKDLPAAMLNTNTESVLSVVSSQKSLGSFKITAKISNN